MFKNALVRLGNILKTPTMPGTCEASLAVLRQMTAAEQARAGVEYARPIEGLAKRFDRFRKEAPAAANAASDAIALGIA